MRIRFAQFGIGALVLLVIAIAVSVALSRPVIAVSNAAPALPASVVRSSAPSGFNARMYDPDYQRRFEANLISPADYPRFADQLAPAGQ